ncbi:hypothetical protein HCN44_009077, partial [Aphidius gifuensis]
TQHNNAMNKKMNVSDHANSVIGFHGQNNNNDRRKEMKQSGFDTDIDLRNNLVNQNINVSDNGHLVVGFHEQNNNNTTREETQQQENFDQENMLENGLMETPLLRQNAYNNSNAFKSDIASKNQ